MSIFQVHGNNSHVQTEIQIRCRKQNDQFDQRESEIGLIKTTQIWQQFPWKMLLENWHVKKCYAQHLNIIQLTVNLS